MSFFSLSGVFLSITSILMAMIMLVGESKKTNILWASVCASMTFLGISMYMVGTQSESDVALMWWRIAHLGVISIPVLVLHTTYSVLKKDSGRILIFLYCLYATTFIFQLLNASGVLITHVHFAFEEFFYIYQPSSLFTLFLGYFNIIFITIFFLLGKEYRSAKRKDFNLATQILYLGLGIGFGALGGYSLYLPLYGVMVYPFLSILMMFYPIVIGYAILHHHLFDARYAIMRVLRVIFIALMTTVFGYIVFNFIYYFFHIEYTLHILEILLFLLVFFFGDLLFRSRRISRYFLLSSLVELEGEISHFLSKKGVYKNIVELLSDLEFFFERGLKVNRVSILQTSVTKKYKYTSRYFHTYRRPLILSELESENLEGSSRDLINEVRSMGCMIFPIELGTKKDLLFLVIGQKESGEKITESEVMMILRILPKIAMSLQILRFNQSLQAEVKRKTHSLDAKNKELESAYEKLKEIDRNKDNFLAIASHELRTPMTIIKGYADLFLQNTLGPMNGDQKKYMKKIFDSTEWLIDLVNNILDISKIEAGRMEIHTAQMPILDTIQSTMENFTSLCKEKGILLDLTQNIISDTMSTDISKFQLVLTNLLSNAYKFTLPGGKITIHAFDTDGKLTVSVSDTGVGISSDRLPFIFEKFNQSENVDYTKKSIKGTGLGLNLSKQIIEMLGGTIQAESIDGKGSTFIFTLPL